MYDFMNKWKVSGGGQEKQLEFLSTKQRSISQKLTWTKLYFASHLNAGARGMDQYLGVRKKSNVPSRFMFQAKSSAPTPFSYL